MPRQWSHSKFEDYACGERYRLKRVVKVPTTPTIFQVVGTAFHEWADAYDLDEGVPDWSRLLEYRVDEAVGKSGYDLKDWDHPAHTRDANYKSYEKFRDETGPDMIDKYAAWREETGWELSSHLPPDDHGNTVGIEYELTYTLGSIEVKAYVDRIFGDKVVDLKTWSKKRPSVQLPGYMIGLRQKGVNVTHGAYYEARKGTHTKLDQYRGWDEQRLAAVYEQAANAEAAGIYIPRPSEDCSSFCSVRAHCAFAI